MSGAEDRTVRAELSEAAEAPCARYRALASSLWNWLHVLANDVVVPSLPIADIGPNDKYGAGEAEREHGLVLETDIYAKCPIVDGVADVIHDLTAHFGIPLTPHLQVFFHQPVYLLSFLRRDRSYGCPSDPHNFRFLRHDPSFLRSPRFARVALAFGIRRRVSYS